MRKFMDLHFEDIHIFTAVAETPNLLEATILLNMSVASVIKRLTEFEENLDIILFERRKKKFILTPLGETVYEYVISTRGNLERFIKEFKCEKLKLELFCESADYVSLFDSWVYDFCLKNTGVSINVSSINMEKRDLLNVNEILISHTPPASPHVIRRQLNPIRRIFCCKKNTYIDDNELPCEISAKNDFIFYNFNNDSQKIQISDRNSNLIFGTEGVNVNSIEFAIKLAIKKNFIIAGVPEHLVYEHIKNGSLKATLPGWKIKSQPTHLIWMDRPYYNEKFSDFIFFIETKWNLMLDSGSEAVFKDVI